LAHRGFRISASNAAAGPDLAVAFDSNSRETSNPRLEGPNNYDRKKWVGGNIDPRLNLGTLLILQEHGYDAEGFVSTWPEAQATNPAGQISFGFTRPVQGFGFDVVGCEGPEAPGLDSGFYIELFYHDDLIGRVGFSEFLDTKSIWFDADNPARFGPRSANRVPPMRAEPFGAELIDRATIHLGGPAAIGSIVLEDRRVQAENYRFPG
jgi:hypothetical protein